MAKLCDVTAPDDIVVVSYFNKVTPSELYNFCVDKSDVKRLVVLETNTLHDELMSLFFVNCEDDLHRPFELFKGRPEMAN